MLKYFLINVILATFLHAAIFSQTVPSGATAGSVEKSLEKEDSIKNLLKPEIMPEIVTPHQPKIPLQKESTRVFIKKIHFTGNTIFSTEELSSLLSEYENKNIAIEELLSAVSTITSWYQSHGYFLAKAYLPEQDIEDHTVTIAIREGFLGKVHIEGEKYYSKSFIREGFISTKDNILYYPLLLRSLLLLNEYPDLSIKAVIDKGAKPGTSDVILKVKDHRPIHLKISANNTGTQYVSPLRENLDFSLGNLIFPGSELSFRGTIGNPISALKFGEAEYMLPVNKYQTKVGVSFFRSVFEVQKEYRSLDAEGNASVLKAFITHPFIRTRTISLDLTSIFNIAQTKNYYLERVNSKDKLRILRFGGRLDIRDPWHGMSVVNAQVSCGLGSLWGGTKKGDPLAGKVDASNNFIKGSLSISRLQSLPYSLQALVSLSGQLTSNPLLSYEQFAIGGMGSVRGYYQAQYMGDYGYRCSGELLYLWSIPKHKTSIRVGPFIDHAGAFLKKAQNNESDDHFLTGTGICAILNLPWNISARIDWSFPLGKKPSDAKKQHFYFSVSTTLF